MKVVLYTITFLFVATVGDAQDMIYSWSGDSAACRISIDPRKEKIKGLPRGKQNVNGFAYIVATFNEDSIRLIYPHEIAGMRVRSKGKFLLPGHYISLPIRNRTDYTRGMEKKQQGGSHRFHRILYQNEALVWLDCKEMEDGVYFGDFMMRRSDSIIFLLYNRNTILASMENISIFPVKETKKQLRGKNYSKTIIRMMNDYRDYTMVNDPGSVTQ